MLRGSLRVSRAVAWVGMVAILGGGAIDHPTFAQAFLDDRCPDEYVYLLGETPYLKVTICGNRTTGEPTHYLETVKRTGARMLLPLQSAVNGRFVARTGGVTYTLDARRGTLTITRPGKSPRVERFTAETP